MADVVDSKTRSRMMSGIRGKNTKPEILIRKALHQRGFRFRLHTSELPGKPDLVFSRYKAVLFVHGCFWHGHDCNYFKLPSTRVEFWREKIYSNQQRDERQIEALRRQGWRVLVVWECVTRKSAILSTSVLAESIANWLKSSSEMASIDLRGIRV